MDATGDRKGGESMKNYNDMYDCKYCGTPISWNDGHGDKGNIWTCENDTCNIDFCSDCAENVIGVRAFQNMISNGEKVLCPDCYINAVKV